MAIQLNSILDGIHRLNFAAALNFYFQRPDQSMRRARSSCSADKVNGMAKVLVRLLMKPDQSLCSLKIHLL